ncbi:nucleotidyl transferase AbiEii/AbiGii toxin family protein [Bounagaea algeriensis]
MPPHNPIQLNRLLGKLARETSERNGVSSGEWLRRWFLQRLAARVFTHDRDGWLLKGGLAMLARYPGARHSRDLDLLHRTCKQDLDEAVHALRVAAQLDLGDMVQFAHLSTQGGPTADGSGESDAGRPCRSVKFTPSVGPKRHNTITVDLVTDMDPVGQPVTRPLEPLFDLPFGEVELQLVSLEDHLADKCCAMYEQHNGAPSSRVKDLVDLVYAISQDTVDGHLLAQAISKEVQRRQAQHTDIDLPDRFTVPERRSWAGGYSTQASTMDGPDHLHSFDAAADLADRFLTPLLQGDSVGRWNPTAGRWTSQA